MGDITAPPRTWILYMRERGKGRFGPVDWRRGVRVTNLVHASRFTDAERAEMTRVDLAHPNNAHLEFAWRPSHG